MQSIEVTDLKTAMLKDKLQSDTTISDLKCKDYSNDS